MSFALALDIGGSHITAAIVDTERRVLLDKSLVRKSMAESAPAQHLLDTWATAAHQSHRLVGSPKLTHIGIAIPSPFDHQKGVSLHEHKFANLYGLNVTAGLRERWTSSSLFSAPVLYGNDADLYVLGEWWGGAARGYGRVMGITLGTGLGSGFLDAGIILTRDSRIPYEGEIWNTPYRGTIAEDYASGRAIMKHYTRLTSRQWDVRHITEAARNQDPQAQLVLNHFGQELGQIIKPWAERFQPEVVVLGGNISRAFDCFEITLKQQVPELNFKLSGLYENASLLGGAALLPRPSEKV